MHRLLMVVVFFAATTAVVAGESIPTSLPELFKHYGAMSSLPLDDKRGKDLWFRQTPAG